KKKQEDDAKAGPAGGGPRKMPDVLDFPLPTPDQARTAYSNLVRLKLAGHQTYLAFQTKLAMCQFFDFDKKSFASIYTEYQKLFEAAKPEDALPDPKIWAEKLSTGFTWNGHEYHRAASYDPACSFSDDAIKAYETLDKFKTAYRGKPAADYLADEADK